MRNIVRKLMRCTLLASERGATAIEYGLICAMIVVAMVIALQNVANKTNMMWNNVAIAVTSN